MPTTLVTFSRPDLDAHRRSIIGRKLTAYTASAKDARAIDRWVTGESQPHNSEVERRLRLAYQIAAVLSECDSAAVVQPWLIDLNPELDDAVPINSCLEGSLELNRKLVRGAARAFIAGG